ncbi:MAG: hypothetical protein AAGA75_22115 [Cyanobacteria bacterium P01_E01_bin.6]
MLIIFLSIFLGISLVLTDIFTLIPLHILQFGHLPSWLCWGLAAIALSWLMGD